MRAQTIDKLNEQLNMMLLNVESPNFYRGFIHNMLYYEAYNNVTNLCSNLKTNLGSQANISETMRHKSIKFYTEKYYYYVLTILFYVITKFYSHVGA